MLPPPKYSFLLSGNNDSHWCRLGPVAEMTPVVSVVRAQYRIKVYRMYRYLDMIWLTIYQIKSIDSHNISKLIILAIKSPYKVPQNSVLLHFYQFNANISHILRYQIYRDIYRVSVQSIDDTIHIGSMFRYWALSVVHLPLITVSIVLAFG